MEMIYIHGYILIQWAMDRYALCKGPLIFGAVKREAEYESNLELRQGYNGTNTKCTFVAM